MRIWPLVIDSQPGYLEGSARRSLLGLPLGTATVYERVRDCVALVTPSAPTILAPAGAGPEYVSQIADVSAGARVVRSMDELVELLAGYEISDVLLVVDPRCLTVSATELGTLTQHFSAEQQVAHHLVAFESAVAGTKEQVSVDRDGQVRSIHRFYDPVTWPFLAGVAASLVPISSGLVRDGQPPASLADLRKGLITRGVSSRDLPMTGGAWNLESEQGLLAANEHLLNDLPDGTKMVAVGAGQQVHASARLIGPIAVHANAVIEHDAIIVGPALVGPNAHIGAGALVVHAIVGAGVAVPAGATVRDLAWFADTDQETSEVPVSRSQTFEERLSRLTFDVRRGEVRKNRDYAIRLQLKAKRLADAVLAAAGLVVLSPLLGAVAAIIRLDSSGSPLYGAEREGKDGRAFTCWKFRTMFTNAHAIQHQLNETPLDGPHFKMERDPRVTRIGRLIRATNIDELPQLYNVLRGTMSLVGPRPSPFRENQICVPWREARLSVRPGMTGLWQVCRQDRESGDFHQWIEYDLLYVRHISFWLDLKILVATVLTAGGQVPVPSSWMIRTETGGRQLPAERPAKTPARHPAVAGRITPSAPGFAPRVDKQSARSA